MQDSVFSKIVKGDIPAEKVYEDELTLAFLTLMPIQAGHTLVISKKQVDHLWDLPEEDYQAVMRTTQKVAKRIREVLKPERVGAKVIGEEVPHAHVHLIPFNTLEEYDQHPQLAAPTDLAEMAKKLHFEDKN